MKAVNRVANPRYPIRLQINVSEEMDDSITDLADMMGITKSEYIRFILGQHLMGQKQATEMIRQSVVDGAQ